MTVALSVVRTEPRVERWDVLIGRMAAGDATALAALYDQTVSNVHALVNRILRDPAQADEVTGDVFLQAWQQAARFDAERGTPLTWLLAIARTRAIDRVRIGVAWRNAQEPIERALNLACERPGPEDVCSTDERRRRVVAALGTLPPEQRAVLELGYYEGLSQSEIAERTDLPLGTVKTRMRLGMVKLRDVLSAPGGLQ